MKSFPFIVYIMEMAVHLILGILMWKMGNWLLCWLSYIWARTYSMCVCVMWTSVDTEIGRGGCTLSCSQHELREWGGDGGLAVLRAPRTFLLQCGCTCCSLAWEAAPHTDTRLVLRVYSSGIFSGLPWPVAETAPSARPPRAPFCLIFTLSTNYCPLYYLFYLFMFFF